MKYSFTFLLVTLLGFVGDLTISPVSAQPQRSSQACPEPQQDQPSSTTREITNDEYGLQFQVPDNYSALLERNDDRLTIIVRNPADSRFLDCVIRNRVIGAGHAVSDVRVSVYPMPVGVRTPNDMVRQLSSQRGIQVRSSSTTIGGRDAVIYNKQTLYPERSQVALLTHPDGQHFVEVSVVNYGESIGSIDSEVFDTVAFSIEF